MKRLALLIGLGVPFALPLNAAAQASSANTDSEVVLASEIKWEQLNPKRGDASPKAANIWGNRNDTGATGFLVKFVDGFSSPPHIHNVTYKGIVLRGLVHNDDPNAKQMWMPKGSYWTQPAGEVHITSAKGRETMAYIEIEKGPYLVLPVEQAFDIGERPVNVDASNLVWLDGSNTSWIESKSDNQPEMSLLWGQPRDEQLHGSLLKLPTGFSGKLNCDGNVRVVVIDGTVNYQSTKESKSKELEPGSYFGSNGNAKHYLSCSSETGCNIYVRTVGKYLVTSDSDKK